MLVTAFKTATFTNVANQTSSANTTSDFKQALDNAASTKDNNKNSYNNTNNDNKKTNNDYNKSNTDDKTKTKDTTKKENTTQTNKPVVKETAKATGEKTVKEISPEEAIEMLAGYLQIAPEQLVETLEVVDINIDELLNNSALLDDIIADNFSFEELLSNSDLQANVMELKTVIEQTDFTLIDEPVLRADFTELVEVEDAFKNTFLQNVNSEKNVTTDQSDLVTTMETVEVEQVVEVDTEGRNSDSNSKQEKGNANAMQTNFDLVGDGEVKIETNFHIPTSYRGVTMPNTTNGSSLLGGGSDVQYKPVVTQIIDNLQIVKLADGTQLTMDLDPQDLGKISLTLVENSGVITANMKVDNDKVKEMVLDQLDALKETLEEQGLTVGEFNVDVQQEENKYQDQMNQQKAKSQKRIDELISIYMDEEFEEGSEGAADVTQLKHDKNVNVQI